MRQYALATGADRERLFDASEVQSLDSHFDAIGDVPRPMASVRSAWPLRLMYGAYLAQPDLSHSGVQSALSDAVSKWHGWVKGDACYALGVCAIRTYPVVDFHGLRIPVAVLVQASADTFALIEGLSPQAASTFVRYENLSPTANLHERLGILALKGEEKNLKAAPLTIHNWTQSIDDVRARRVAERLR